MEQQERIAQLKAYLRRLGDGESLEQVRADFVKEFGDVDAVEIMKAEQAIIAEGTPIEEVQKLCDVHAALFHGKTKEEQIADAKHAVNASVIRQERQSKLQELCEIIGHPLWVFTKENEELSHKIKAAKDAIRIRSAHKETLETIRELSIHYAKKGDLLYPLLSVKYGISGPADVMWTVDDEIRDEISRLARADRVDEIWIQRFEEVLNRADEMIFKEENILFPNCAANFTEEDWILIYHDQKDYAACFGVKQERWELAETNHKKINPSVFEKEVLLSGGHMTVEQLSAMLNTMPFEITFVDANNINCFFNEGPKDFKRPQMAIDRDVFSCHPPKIGQKVRHIIESFREGTLDEVPVWMEKNGKNLLVRYIAVRDSEKQYVGTLELVQDVTFIREYYARIKQGSE